MHERPGSRATARSSTASGTGARFKLIDTGGVDFERRGPAGRLDPRPGARRRSPTPQRRRARRRRARGRAPGRRGAGRPAAPLAAAGDRRREQDATASPTMPLAAEFHRLGLGEPMAVSAAQGLGIGRPARPHRRAAAGRRAPSADDDDDPPGRDRPPERRQVLARQPLPRRGARDRLRGRGHDPRRDRHAAAGRRAAADADRHRRACAASRRSPTRSSTTRRCARSGRPSAPTSRSSCATRPTASPRRTCAIAELAMKAGCATAIVLNKWDLHEGDERATCSTTSARASPRSCACARAC